MPCGRGVVGCCGLRVPVEDVRAVAVVLLRLLAGLEEGEQRVGAERAIVEALGEFAQHGLSYGEEQDFEGVGELQGLLLRVRVLVTVLVVVVLGRPTDGFEQGFQRLLVVHRSQQAVRADGRPAAALVLAGAPVVQDLEDVGHRQQLGHGEGVGGGQPGAEVVVVRPRFDEMGHGGRQVGVGELSGRRGCPGPHQGAAVLGELTDPLGEGGTG